jgi:aldose 1-epimerase
MPGDQSFGSVVGRFGNRIDGGRFELNGKEYRLEINETANNNQLHGGSRGFSEKVWETGEVTGNSIELMLRSPDGEMGYPGNLSLTVKYLLTENNELEVHYHATTDAPTPLNVTQHSYFNLDGEGSGDILDHELMINADHYTPVNERMIPTGEIAPVEGTPMDFRTAVKIGARIEEDFEQLVLGIGYDHNWVLNGDGMKLAAKVVSEKSGRVLEVLTTEPGVQFYCGNFLDGSQTGKSGATYRHRYGFCLETQHFPDSPNQPGFPSTILDPGEEFSSKTVFRFSVR